MEQYRIIKTGLKTQKECDILDGVFGQLSDGMWENSRAAEGYWPYIDADLKNGEVVLTVSNSYRYDGRPTNKLLDMSDDDVKKWLAKKIKQVIKEEGLDWDRGNEEETDYLDTEWRKSKQPSTVADCYYVYEVLKGRNVAKHPEYSKQMNISDALDILDDAKIKYVRPEDDEPWDMDESANSKRGRAVNEKDDSGQEMSWVKLEYNGTNPKIRAKCRKLYTDEQLAQHKLLSQEYIYDIIYFPDNHPSNRRKAEEEIIRRNLDIIRTDDRFYIGGPNYDRSIPHDKLTDLDESATYWPLLSEADLTPEQREARRRRAKDRRELKRLSNYGFVKECGKGPYYVRLYMKLGNLGNGWWQEGSSEHPIYKGYPTLAAVKAAYPGVIEDLLDGKALRWEDGEGPQNRIRMVLGATIPNRIRARIDADLAHGKKESIHYPNED